LVCSKNAEREECCMAYSISKGNNSSIIPHESAMNHQVSSTNHQFNDLKFPDDLVIGD